MNDMSMLFYGPVSSELDVGFLELLLAGSTPALELAYRLPKPSVSSMFLSLAWQCYYVL